MEHSDSIEVAASPEAAFALVSDLPAMGRFSPENTGGEWLGGARGPALHARFRGTNAQGRRTWTTRAKVVAYDPPRTFAFAVTYLGAKVATWTYEIAPTDTGCRITESWRDRRSVPFKAVAKTVEDRDAYTRHSVRHTLEAMKTELERS